MSKLKVAGGFMRTVMVAIGLMVYCGLASAQWAVLDEEVRKIVEKISFVNGGAGEQKFEAFDVQSELNAKFAVIV